MSEREYGMYVPDAPGPMDDDDGVFRATAGEPIDPSVTPLASREAVVDGLRTVYDPEIPVNIYDLGLIYDFTVGEDGATHVTMTLTTAGCPVAGSMPGMVAEAVAAVEGTGVVEVELVWDPPWNPEMISEDAKLALGLD